MNGSKLKNYNLKDTIVALATFPSPAALGIIKISGKKAITIVSKIFSPKNKKNLKTIKSYTLHYGWIKDKTQILDEVLVSIMRKPNSYTKEDVVEISSHGGILVINKILELILKNKARLALPGEFTYRAFINGRIDLLKAQSILDIIEARTQDGLKKAISQLKGDASLKIKMIKDKVKELFIFIEAQINFPEDEITLPIQKIKNELNNISKQFKDLVLASNRGFFLRQGIKCVICGKANVGKSTLYNRLVKADRVIVSEYAGTTRDVVEETIIIKGLTLKLFDTAGIMDGKDILTQKAQEKTDQAIREADLILLVLDRSLALDREDKMLLEKLKNKNVIAVLNKSDLVSKLSLKDITITNNRICLSALNAESMKDLEEAIYKNVYKKGVSGYDTLFLNQYQNQILKSIDSNIDEAKRLLDSGYPIDFLHLALKTSLDNLDKITGDNYSQDILESIFSQFCIGK